MSTILHRTPQSRPLSRRVASVLLASAAWVFLPAPTLAQDIAAAPTLEAPVATQAAPFALSVSEGGADRHPLAESGLGNVDIQLKFDGLDVRPLLNVSTADLRRRFKPGETVQFLTSANYPAFIEHAEIRVHRAGEERGERPLAVIPAVPNGVAAWEMPDDAMPENDALTYVLRVYDAKGRYDETEPLALQRTDRSAVATDEEGPLVVTPGASEDRTAIRNIPLKGGAVTVAGRQVPEGHTVTLLGEKVPVDARGAFVMQRLLPPGAHEVDVAVTSEADGDSLVLNRRIDVPKEEWFYTGLADFTVGKRSGDDDIDLVRSGDYDDVWGTGRLAFYAKGKLKGETILTAAADTTERSIGKIFKGLDSQSPRYLLRRMDPDDHYPVYGDDSTLIEDAPTAGKFFVKAENGASHAMWGSYKSAITGTEFLRADRGLYGGQGVYRSEETTAFGESRAEVTVYGAQPETLPQRDEFAATGGSAFFLKRQDITLGSETVTIEIRDNISGRVIERRTLMYGVDYSFDYMQGMLILTQPVNSATAASGPVRNGALGGNNVFVIAQYEYVPKAGELDGYIYGGRASGWLTENLRLGMTGMNEKTGEADQQLYGFDAQLRLSETSFLEGEVARSKGPGFGLSRSWDGGLNSSDIATSGTRADAATAWRLRGQLDLADISEDLATGTMSGYLEKREAGFSTIAEQIHADQTVWGVKGNVPLGGRVRLGYAYDSFKDDASSVQREGSTSLSWNFADPWTVSLGTTFYESRSLLAAQSGKSGYNGSRVDLGARLEYLTARDASTYVFGQVTVDRDSDIVGNDRAGVGATVPVTEKVKLSGEVSYGDTGLGALASANYQPAADDNYYIGYRLDPDRAYDLDRTYDLAGRDRGAIVGGLKRKLGETIAAYNENSYDMFGRQRTLTQTYGVTYTPAPKWVFDAGMEAGFVRDRTLDPTTGLERSDFKRRAVTLAVRHNDEERGLSVLTRLEARFEESDDNTRDRNTYLLTTGVMVRTHEDWRLLANVDTVLSDKTDGAFYDGEYVEASAGFAYRPVDNDRLNALFRYTWLYDLPATGQDSAYGGEFGAAQRSHIVSADFIYDLNQWISLGAKYGARFSQTRARVMGGSEDFGPWEKNSAHLGVLRADFHVVKKWDWLVEGRVMHMPEAATTDYGLLTALYRHVGDNLKVGVGYNFGSFSDDLRDLTLNDRGWFLNVVGKF